MLPWSLPKAMLTHKKLLSITVKPKKSILTITPTAIRRLQALSEEPSPKIIRIGIKSRGCSGMMYSLEYVDKKNKLDEEIEQDGVKVLIESKALMSVIGTEMDYTEEPLASRFVFNNPNVKESCGCGLSFRT